MREARLTVGDYAAPGRGDSTNPCVMGCAHLFLGSLFVFGEGNGGIEDGRVESRLAVSAVLANFRASTVTDPKRRLEEALTHAGEILHSRSRSGPAFSDAWATCVAVLVRKGHMYAARVGDSTLALVRGGQLLNVFEGQNRDPLGQNAEVAVQTLDEPLLLEAGDRFILSNKALFNTVDVEEIGRIASSLVPAVAARRLIEAVERAETDVPCSIQIVQVGDGNTMVEGVAPPQRQREPSSLVPVAPIRSTPATAPVPAVTNHSRKTSEDAPDPQPSVPWPIVVAALVVLGLGGFLVSKFFGDEDAVPSALAENTASDEEGEAKAGGSPDANEDTGFWVRVSRRLGPTGQVLDPTEVKRWLDGPQDREQRLREARAVIAVLSVPADTEEPALAHVEDGDPTAETEPSDSENPTGQPEAAEQQPTEPPVADSEPADAEPAEAGGPGTTAPGEWNPKRLPPHLRHYDRLFSNPNPTKAGAMLRGYIHRRHRKVTKVLGNLDSYLELAPKERSIAVLQKMVDGKPGPRSRHWALTSLKRLRKDLNL